MRSQRISRPIKVKPKQGLASVRLSRQRLHAHLQRSLVLQLSHLKRRVRLVPATNPSSLVVVVPPRKRLRLTLHWRFWALVTTGLALSIGTLAAVALLRTPAEPRCNRVFWPLAPASLRLHCAQVSANQQTLESLLAAIRLVNQLPENHPLRPEINRLIEVWSQNIFDLAEESYQDGKLKRAIYFARQIPQTTKVWLQVPPQIKQWQQTWAKAEAIDRRVEALLRQLNWRQAFWEAVRLTLLGNRYWKDVHFEVLSQRIMQAQEDESTLAKARQLTRNGDLESLLQALKLAQGIGPGSYFHQSAQKAIAGISGQMLGLAAWFLDRQDLQGALTAAQAIPDTVPLWAEAQDFIVLAYAQSWTWSDTVMGLEEAIQKARTLGKQRPLYARAQDLIGRWQLERDALLVLNQAQELAIGGGIEQLNAAIAKAFEVATDNPRWPQAQEQIGRWQRQVETMQDQPLLDRAQELAWSGQVSDLRSAIAVANQIGPGRALYPEAQTRVRDWQEQVQLALNPPMPSPAAEADRQAQQLIREARKVAQRGSLQALASAIEIINQVSDVSVSRGDADLAIDQWSQAILEIARKQAQNNPADAIAIAEQIPSFTGAYAEAQYLIREWQTQRQPTIP